MDPTSFGSLKKHNSPLSRSLFKRHTCPSSAFTYLLYNTLQHACDNISRSCFLFQPSGVDVSPNSTNSHSPPLLYTSETRSNYIGNARILNTIRLSSRLSVLCRFNLSANPHSHSFNTFCILRRTTKNIPCKSKSLNHNHSFGIQSFALVPVLVSTVLALDSPGHLFIHISHCPLAASTDQQHSNNTFTTNLHRRQQHSQ